MFHELLSRDRGDGCDTGQPQGVGPEDARKDGQIIRARCAPLSPASGFPVSRSQQATREISGLERIRLQF
jgi:hypothetical protein